jgi:hypothetical protein
MVWWDWDCVQFRDYNPWWSNSYATDFCFRGGDMIPITRHDNFYDAHSEFFMHVGENPSLAIGPKPVDADALGVVYLVYQDEFRNIVCQYELNDRHYTQTEMKRLIKRHQQATK